MDKSTIRMDKSIDNRPPADIIFPESPSENSQHSSMEECPSALEDTPGVSGKKEVKQDMTSAMSRNMNFQSVLRVPKVAVQEKIIICIENSHGESVGYTFCDLDENVKEPNTHEIRNEALRMFMVNKLALAKDTEFATVALEHGKLRKLSQFTNNLNELSKSLRDYNKESSDESNRPTIDITPIFSDVLATVDVPECSNVTVIPPDFVVRVIFVFGSSFLMPLVNTNDPSFAKLKSSPYFFFDVFYLHDKPSDFNHVERIYQEFCKIVPPSSYLLTSSRDVTKVFNNAMKLLAHPNQRPIDTVWNF